MNLTETVPLRGAFSLTVIKRGIVIEQIDEPNLIVNGARAQLARLTGGAGANRQVTHIGFGVGTAAANPNNTGLSNAVWKPVTGVTYPEPGHAAFDWSLSTSEANGMAITEFGLRCADGTLFSRKVRSAIHKSDDLSLAGVWTIIF